MPTLTHYPYLPVSTMVDEDFVQQFGGQQYRAPSLLEIIDGAVFQVSVIVNLISALGMPLYSAWLIGSTAQAGCLIAVLAKPDASKNQAVAVVCLIASNCMNIWFGIEFFDAALRGT